MNPSDECKLQSSMAYAMAGFFAGAVRAAAALRGVLMVEDNANSQRLAESNWLKIQHLVEGAAEAEPDPAAAFARAKAIYSTLLFTDAVNLNFEGEYEPNTMN